jgi:hypothetical protein
MERSIKKELSNIKDKSCVDVVQKAQHYINNIREILIAEESMRNAAELIRSEPYCYAQILGMPHEITFKDSLKGRVKRYALKEAGIDTQATFFSRPRFWGISGSFRGSVSYDIVYSPKTNTPSSTASVLGKIESLEKDGGCKRGPLTGFSYVEKSGEIYNSTTNCFQKSTLVNFKRPNSAYIIFQTEEATKYNLSNMPSWDPPKERSYYQQQYQICNDQIDLEQELENYYKAFLAKKLCYSKYEKTPKRPSVRPIGDNRDFIPVLGELKVLPDDKQVAQAVYETLGMDGIKILISLAAEDYSALTQSEEISIDPLRDDLRRVSSQITTLNLVEKYKISVSLPYVQKEDIKRYLKGREKYRYIVEQVKLVQKYKHQLNNQTRLKQKKLIFQDY